MTIGGQSTQPPLDSRENEPRDSVIWLTPEEAANRLKVSAEHIRAMIRTGRLDAVNLAIGKKRPLYRIRATALNAMTPGAVESRRHTRSSPQFKRLPPVEDHFPNLR